MDSLMRVCVPATAGRFGARLARELLKRGIDADLNGDRCRMIVSLCHGLVATVNDTDIRWCSPQVRSGGRRLCRIRRTVDGAAAALAADYRLLNGDDGPARARGSARAAPS
ncbi:hypothetical protein [Spongiactinospora sp. TRM90649]|uniref:hypothetical protein n=1 Tax=Spongiactinospora sp. TRM90649 TaxID=3031114 RepID=UPI0023F89749|nr:hypothetical protein [Spongiactinospora sp. TRM90649]MDF5756577.1 hypothetical protein [Spongiactinospora sp. TRM90649]